MNTVCGSYKMVVLREQLFRFCLYKHVQLKEKKSACGESN